VISIMLLARFILYFKLRSTRNWEYLLPGCLVVKHWANTREDHVGTSYHVESDFWVAHGEDLLINSSDRFASEEVLLKVEGGLCGGRFFLVWCSFSTV
jgi:hypothetical protein